MAKWSPSTPITRFAPSPTGHLHLGHVLSMAYVFGLADSLGARILLRIEDHDRQRCRKEYERSIFDDIAWLGFYPDNWNELTQQKKSIYRQSDNHERYDECLSQLGSQDLLYLCSCSRKDIIEASLYRSNELFYPGTCRHKKLSKPIEAGVRCLFDEVSMSWQDLYHGDLTHTPAHQCGDLLLQDRHQNYTYNYAVVVDDIDQDINLIIRGDDLVHTTGRQMLLRKLLESDSSVHFAHHPLLWENEGQKLSKRARADGIIQRRLAGEHASEVLGDALFQAGIIATHHPVKRIDLPEILLR